MNRYIRKTEEGQNRRYFYFRPGNPYGLAHLGYLNYTSAKEPLLQHVHHNVTELCYVEKGAPTLTFEDVPYLVKSGQGFLCPPGKPHGSGANPLDRMKMFWIGYRPDDVSQCLFPPRFDAEKERREFVKAVSCDEPQVFSINRKIKNNLERLLNLCRSEEPQPHLSVMTEMSELFHAIASRKRDDGTISAEIRKVCSYIEENLEGELVLEDLASRINLSESRFKSRFRSETGLPPREYILRRKLDRAKALLSDGKSVVYAAMEMGFSSSQYFSTVFRRYTSLSPSQWLKKRQLRPGTPT